MHRQGKAAFTLATPAIALVSLGLPGDSDDVSIAKAVISMAHSLGLRVVAESVETCEQRAFLAAHGCEEMQSYLLSRPMPAADCEKLLEPSISRRAA